MSRFENHLKKQLININKNLYLSKDDPLYYEKILRYADPNSAEAHYWQGKKLEKDGVFAKALLHYHEALQADSPYYFKAKKAIQFLESRIHSPENKQVSNRKMPIYVKAIFSLLIILFLALLFWTPTLKTIVASVKQWDTGIDVVYESVDVPYVIYIPDNMTTDEITKVLYKKALNLGDGMPDKTLLLYGIMTANHQDILQAFPLKNEKLKEDAFVIAKYNPSFDQSVNIRFLNPEFNGEGSNSLTFVGTNIVRTALQTYIKEKGHTPNKMEDLTKDYPDNYLSFIPNEMQTGSNQVYDLFNGKGGWVYNKNAKNIAQMFYPNTANYSIPFHPVEIFINKGEFSLTVTTAPYIISKKAVGLGKHDSTPEGLFEITDKVMKPKGKYSNMYGSAGLGMGKIAIHGTIDKNSIHSEKSHGCIRLTNDDILDIFDYIPKGTIVNITDSVPTFEENEVNHTDQLIPFIKPAIRQTTNAIFSWAG